MKLALLLSLLISKFIAGYAHREYTNDWAVEIKGGRDVAERVAREHGYQIVSLIEPLDDHYVLRHTDVKERSKRSARYHTNRLARDKRVTWVEQQDLKLRYKRGQQSQIELGDFLREADSLDRISRMYYDDSFNDPEWHNEWYLHDKENKLGEKRDMNVIPMWRRATGKGVVVTILDDGIEPNHPELRDSYDPEASYDLNDNDPDPSPRVEETSFNKHGTRCAGEIVMKPNNNFCGVGIAFGSKIGGIRMLDGAITDSLEARALAYHHNHIDIMSSSWGPSDHAKTVEGPGKLASKAILKGITEGRQGKGIIYVWASGNGGRWGDSCACDGYVSSMYTLSINSASMSLQAPWYSETCASTIATAYSSGSRREGMVVSSDLRGECTEQHSGTSAAAPLGAGVVALALEINGNLTWRDVQHLIILTSKYEPLAKNDGWYKNYAGFQVNGKFGFGLMDASKMVEQANGWKNVGKQLRCDVPADAPLSRNLHDGSVVTITLDATRCKNKNSSDIRYLEHVQVVVTLAYSRRGRLSIDVISPSGTKTNVLPPRERDDSEEGLKAWPFTSLHTWGENPEGKWTVIIADKVSKSSQKGAVKDVRLILYGTHEKPDYRTKMDDRGNVHEMERVEQPVSGEDKRRGRDNFQDLMRLLRVVGRY